MKIWIINPFDPLPGGTEQLGRYAYLVKLLGERGHQVTWWSSTFSHRFKREIDAAQARQSAESLGFELELVESPPYGSNVSFRRLRSHRVYGRNLGRMMATTPPPDVILASSPPLEAAAEAAKAGRRWGVPAIVDIQDQWPDTFARAVPAPLRSMSRLLLSPWYSLERRAYRAADGIVGVGDGYVQRGLAVGGSKPLTGEFPLGVDVADVDAAAQRGAERYPRWKKQPHRLRFVYSGSLSYSYDFQTIIRAAALTKRNPGTPVDFVLTGQGDLAHVAHEMVAADQLDNVTVTGFLDFDEWAYLMYESDAGFNASFPHALIYLPNKIFYYFAAGQAVLNTIPGECANLVERHGCGLTYDAGDADGCFAAIRRLAEEPRQLQRMKSAARLAAETVFDRRIIYARYADFLENAAARRQSPHAAIA